MPQENTVDQEKKEYVTPTITSVRLIAGEAVLGACKNYTHASDVCAPTYSCITNGSPVS